MNHALLPTLLLAGALLVGLGTTPQAQAAAHARKVEPGLALTSGKRVVQLDPVPPVAIDLPDDARALWGQDLDGALIRKLEASQRFVVLTPQNPPARIVGRGSAQQVGPVYHWSASALPSATVQLRVTQMAFLTGDRGGRMFYGFNDRIPNLPNEFPLRDTLLEANWMDRTFDAVGVVPWDSQSGLDLGDGFSFSAIVAGVRARYARYEARLNVEMQITRISGERETRYVEVDTDGFFVDVAGGYLGYSAGIRIARRDAMMRAMEQAATGVAESLVKSLSMLPLTALVDAILPTGEWLLGTGFGAAVPVATRYRSMREPQCTLVVVQTTQEGVVARPESACAESGLGTQFVEALGSGAGAGVAAVGARSSSAMETSEQIHLPGQHFAAAQGLGQALSGFDPMDIARFFALPYRIFRYFQYDRALAQRPDAQPRRERLAAWPGSRYRGEGVRVAIVDSGVDYNHPAIWGRVTGIHPNRDVGFDAIAGDERAYDDGYHGTEVASAVLSVAPRVDVLPIKAFNPWGVTRTSALVAAVRYAVESGAEILLLPWATRRESPALKAALLAAQDVGMVIVTAAGDRGEDLRRYPAFPAAWRGDLGGVVVVSGLGASGQVLTAQLGKKSNFSTEFVDIAAPGESVRVARPRGGWATVTHTGVAAGAVAGAIARELQWGRDHGDPSVRAARDRVLESATREARIETRVQGGRVLRLRSELVE